MNRPETTMMPMPDTMPRLIARFLRLLACSCLTAAVLLGVIGCGQGETASGNTTSQGHRGRLQKDDHADRGRPIGTTRALNDVTIRARVKGFLEEKHFEDGKNVKKGDLLLVIEEKPYQVSSSWPRPSWRRPRRRSRRPRPPRRTGLQSQAGA